MAEHVLLHYAASSESSVIYRKTGIRSPAPVIYLRHAGHETVYVAPYEYLYYQEFSSAEDVRCVDTLPGYSGQFADPLADLLLPMSAKVGVPATFPAWLFEKLSERGIAVYVDEYAFLRELLTNGPGDLAEMRSVSRVLGQCLDTLQDHLRQCRIEKDQLTHDGAQVDNRWLARLASVFLAERDVACEYAIVAGGPQSFHPHHQMPHPLRPREPIIVDVACRSISSGFYADASRTWCRGEPANARFIELYDLIATVKERVERRMAPSVSVARLHDLAMALLRDGGVRTPGGSAGLAFGDGPVMHHALGHGIGRNLHQPPIIGAQANVPLMTGMVLAFEPGCYIWREGGVRLEDTIEVTDSGMATMTLTRSAEFVLE